ncbi:MAG TPA: amidohydrolase [Solirubrobacteraceae bacterium]|jgi:hypothetical protein
MQVSTVFENASFVTDVRTGRSAEAVATSGDRIVFTGSRDEARSLAAGSTRFVDCAGATVLPGFTDSHTHLLDGAVSRYHEIVFDASPAATSLADVYRRMSEHAVNLGADAFVLGSNIRDESLAERRYPVRAELDAVAGGRPIVLFSTGDHIACANSRALEIAGIDRSTPDPPGGSIDRDPSGEPTGILRERGKLRLARGAPDTVIPRYTHADRVSALAKIFEREIAPCGLTALDVMATSGEEVRAYHDAVVGGGLQARVNLLLRVIESEISLAAISQAGMWPKCGDQHLRVNGVKISIDGGSLQRNAAMHHHYAGEPNNVGIVRIEEPDVVATIAQADRLGFRNVVHAIGDRACDIALGSFEQVGLRRGGDHRTRLEHFGNLPVSDEQIWRAAGIGLIASPQPSFLQVFGDKWLDIFGEEMMQRSFPLRSLHDAGIPMIGGSDYSMTPLNPLIGVRAAVVRATASGVLLNPAQALTVGEALDLYTGAAAWSSFDEHARGRLAPGQLADMTALAGNPYSMDPRELDLVEVAMTIVGGAIVYRRSDVTAN